MVEKIVWSPIAISEYARMIEFLMMIWNVEIIVEFEVIAWII